LPRCPKGNLVGEDLRHHGRLGERLACGEADVEADRVGELGRTHRHAEPLHRGVQRLRLVALVQQAKGVLHVRSEHPVHQEPGRVLHRQRQLVDLAHECSGVLRKLRFCFFSRNDFDELQLRYGIEKMDAHQPRRILERGGDVG
jgi:hypothetical protein